MNFDWNFLSDLVSIVAINLVLSGDNAIVLAMAVRTLPLEQRKKGILYGTFVAVSLQIILTFFVAQLLQLHFIKLLAGASLIWIGFKLFVESSPDGGFEKELSNLQEAIKLVVIANITMAFDNMLAVGAASHGNLWLLMVGLGLSIPFVIFTSNLLSTLIDRYPIIIYLGSAMLGKVAGEMIATDAFVAHVLPTSKMIQHFTEIVCAIGIIVVGKLYLLHMERKQILEQSEFDARGYVEGGIDE